MWQSPACEAASRSMKVILLKEPKGDQAPDPYMEVLSSHGLQATLIPVLSFQFVSVELLFHKLCHPESYEGLIFTSPRAVEAVQLCLQTSANKNAWESTLKSKWNSKHVYVVGKATAALVHSLGLTSEGDASGNAEKLADFICSKEVSYFAPILFPCGSLKREVLPERLKKKDIPLESITVYQTAQHPDIRSSLTQYFKQDGLPASIVFFSPSGVKFCLDIIRLLSTDKLHQIKFAAIGSTTAEAMVAEGLHVSCTAPNPTPQDLGEAIVKVLIQEHC